MNPKSQSPQGWIKKLRTLFRKHAKKTIEQTGEIGVPLRDFELKVKVEGLFEDAIAAAEKKAREDFARELKERIYAEPCEPDCTDVRHARHEGEWACHNRTVETIDQLLESEQR